jgi:hypothetical protein
LEVRVATGCPQDGFIHELRVSCSCVLRGSINIGDYLVLLVEFISFID